MVSPKMSNQSPEMKASTLSPASLLMRPPLCAVPTDLSASSNDITNVNNNASNDDCSDSSNPNMLQVPNKRTATNAAGRMKKLRFIKHASVAGMNETKVDDIATDIIIPRERVVSICNMDKDALDDYLNEGGDSQEQEAELLQYFQSTSGQEKLSQTTVTDTIASTNTATVSTGSIAIPSTNAYPMLENYQLNQNSTVDSNVRVTDNTHMSNTVTSSNQMLRKQDQINELRQYLQQNLQQPPVIQSGATSKNAEERSETSNSQVSSEHEFHVDWKNSNTAMHSASSSLTALSLPYQQTAQDNQTEETSLDAINVKIAQRKILPTAAQAVLLRSVRASSALVANPTQQSPNFRSKNFNFVPISPGPQSPRVTSQPIPQMQSNIHSAHGRNPFLSPRRSPAVRKLVNKDLGSCLKSLQEPTITSFDSTFKNEISASAPASPSITPHHFQFNTTIINPYCNTTTHSANASLNQVHHPNQHQHQATCSISGMCPVLERSQSVPLHCQSPAFNAPVSNTTYNSICNSMAQTPVPSEFADFSEDNFLDLLAESSTDHLINNKGNKMTNLMQGDCNRNITSNVSRSVPSTPLPMSGFHLNPMSNFGNIAGMDSNSLMTNLTKNSVDNSKSVPTTPIATIGNSTTPFRYSPNMHRDFLINGNTVDGIKCTHFYSTQPNSSSSSQSQRNVPQHQSVSSTQSNTQVLLATSTQPIKDLPN